MRRPIARTGLGLLAALALAVSGCAAGGTGDTGGTGTAGQPQPADPRLALAASAETLQQEPFAFELTVGELLTAGGVADPAGEAGRTTLDIDAGPMVMTAEVVVIGTDLWVDADQLAGMLGVETEWLHVDQTRLGEGDLLGMAPGQPDLAGTADMLSALGEVEQVDAHTYRGTIDPAKIKSGLLGQGRLEPAGDTPLDFVATVDDQGRLTHLVVTLPPEAPAEELDLRYFDYGTPVEVSPPPAGAVSELPAELYDLLSG